MTSWQCDQSVNIRQLFEGLLYIWQNVELPLEIFLAIGHIFIVTNGQIWKFNLAIWSQPVENKLLKCSHASKMAKVQSGASTPAKLTKTLCQKHFLNQQKSHL